MSNQQKDLVREGLEDLYPRLWRFAKLTTGNADTAKDLLQATCERALIKAHLYRPEGKLESWLYKMMRRVWLNELRAQKTKGMGETYPIEVDALVSPANSVEMNIFTGEVLSIIQGLPETQRQAVYLVYVEGLKYVEAAEVLSVPIGTIMSRLSTARKKVSAAVNER